MRLANKNIRNSHASLKPRLSKFGKRGFLIENRAIFCEYELRRDLFEMENPHDVTQLLLKWSQGDQEALENLLPMVYRELHKIAHRYLNKERGEHTLQTTALVHEAYIKLIDQTRVQWQNRAHFFGIAAQAMRRILVDNARQRLAGKRGKGAEKISIDDKEIDISDEKASNLVELDFALKKLAELDPNKSRLVELRYFGGLSLEETAEVLGISRPTVIRQWRLAKAWLYKEIAGEDSVKDKG